ncbi:2-iminoacetate synthase [bacterium BMS3Abin14]|nr:2-iminoacetate synthase [bacterium BMS3Abin14]
MTFFDEMQLHPWDQVEKDLMHRTTVDVERALSSDRYGLNDMISLLSPAADPMIEEIARQAQALTRQRFGRTMGLFAPLYLSSSCTNSCVYCSFNTANPIRRVTLSSNQARSEGVYLHDQGFRHILLVSGEDRKAAGPDYLVEVVRQLRPLFDSISIEVYPMETTEYRKLAENGVDGLAVYQETYNTVRYGKVHRAGRKRDFRWRLETPERGGEAGFRRIGLGALLGLSDWRIEAVFLALHARYLMRRHWKSQLTISFPRLRPAVGSYCPPCPVTDRDFVHMLTAFRLFLPDGGLVLSTRESPLLRDHLISLGVTSMSAGSCTEPGGYTQHDGSEGQFQISDHRSPVEIAEVIRRHGYDPIWKDWDAEFVR